MSSFELILGPMLIGVFANTILYGVLLVQSYIYYRTYKKDPLWIRYFVFYLFIVETLNTGFDIGIMYEPLIRRFGTERAVTTAPLMLDADPIVTVMVSTPVQLFMAWRIQIINKSTFITSAIIFFAFFGGLATTISVTLIPEFARLQKFHGAVITWLASSAAGDVVITASLAWSLYKQKTGFKRTDDRISQIIKLTIQTGLITAISAAADVIIFIVVPKTTLLNARAGWNNLTDSSETHNVLFGSQVFGSEMQVTINGKLSHQLQADRHIERLGESEWDTYLYMADTPTTSKVMSREQGDSVTRFEENPVPAPAPKSHRKYASSMEGLRGGTGNGLDLRRYTTK